MPKLVGFRTLIALLEELQRFVNDVLNKYELEVPTLHESVKRRNEFRKIVASILAEAQALNTINAPREEKNLLADIEAGVEKMTANCSQEDLNQVNAILRKIEHF